jgi:hypothetical protein
MSIKEAMGTNKADTAANPEAMYLAVRSFIIQRSRAT